MPLAARRDAIASRQSSGPSPERLPSKLGASGVNASSRSQTFPRDAKLLRRAEFDAVYRTGKRLSSATFTVFACPNQRPLSRFGFSIKKALGGAVVRNRIRRRLREAVRLHRQEIPTGWDIVIHPKDKARTAPFAALQQEVVQVLKKL